MNACGYGVGKPDCEYSVALLSIDVFSSCVKARSKTSASVSSAGVLERSAERELIMLEECWVVEDETKDMLRLRRVWSVPTVTVKRVADNRQP